MVYCPHDLLGKEGERVTRTRWWWWLWGKQLAWGWHEESRRKTRWLDIKGSPRECARLLSVVSWGQPAPRETSCGASARLSPVQRFVKREEKRTQIRETNRNKNSGFEIGYILEKWISWPSWPPSLKTNIVQYYDAVAVIFLWIVYQLGLKWRVFVLLGQSLARPSRILGQGYIQAGTFWGVFDFSLCIWRSAQIGYC